MRIKTLLLTAALATAGALSSMAQSNVYSLNVVGYVNLTLTNGFQMVANQLDFDGTGTNNTLQTVFGTNLPNLSRVYIYSSSSATFSIATYISSSGTWGGATAAADAALNPGGGVFLSIPASATTPVTVTTVGTVLQGSLSTPFSEGFNIISSKVPLSAGVGALGLSTNIANLSYIYQFLPSTQGYGPKHIYLASTGTWSGGGEPTPAVGESFWFNSPSAGTWATTFTVQ
jgi:hypothetical protein